MTISQFEVRSNPGLASEAGTTARPTAFPKRSYERSRKPLPPYEMRDWMTPNETGLLLGCSVATVHRLRRGLIAGVDPLPCIQYGRKFVFRKPSVAEWQDRNEK